MVRSHAKSKDHSTARRVYGEIEWAKVEKSDFWMSAGVEAFEDVHQ